MSLPLINYCPSTLAEGFDTYSPTALKRLFAGRKVSHILPYNSPASHEETSDIFNNNRLQISISGVQEKFSLTLDKNQLRLVKPDEQGQYILKPIPQVGKNPGEMPANEHVSMQIARQVFGIETAENALIFFKDGTPAYLTRRFDVLQDGTKRAQEDFASLAGRTVQTHGGNYKYLGNCLDLFETMRRYVPAYPVEAPRLFKIVLFNYLICNGDAHFKNFSIVETALGDFKLSPAYDLLNSRVHIADSDFALDEGLLPRKYAQGKIREQFFTLGVKAGIPQSQITKIFTLVTTSTERVIMFLERSYLTEKTKRNYIQTFQGRMKRIFQ